MYPTNNYYKITPEGTKDLLFDECYLRRETEQKVLSVFRSRGYDEVITPEIEYMDVFARWQRNFSFDNMYKLTDNRGHLVVLRPDSTMPIARICATRLQNASLPIRLCYSQKVYRSMANMRGRSHEILQSGMELIGVASKRSDLEVITTAVDVLSKCTTGDFRLELGHYSIFEDLMDSLSVEEELRAQIRWCVEHKNYPQLEQLLDASFDAKTAKKIAQLPKLFGHEEVFETAIELFQDAKITKTVEYLQELYCCLIDLGLEGRISVDLGMINRADYYDGLVFQGYVADSGEAVLVGGRYDKLIADFGRSLPAIGFAVNVNEVVSVYYAKGLVPQKETPTILVVSEQGYELQGNLKCKELIESGVLAEHSVFDQLEESKQYAKEQGIAKILLVANETKEIMVG